MIGEVCIKMDFCGKISFFEQNICQEKIQIWDSNCPLIADSSLTVGWGKTCLRVGWVPPRKRAWLGNQKSQNRCMGVKTEPTTRATNAPLTKKRCFGPKSRFSGKKKTLIMPSHVLVVQRKKCLFPQWISVFKPFVQKTGFCHTDDRPDQTRPDQTRPDQTRPDQTRPD